MNEGCACFVHYYIMNRLYDKGLIDDGIMLEFIDYHTRVVSQPGFDQPGFSGINPYALGFAIMQDIQRICENPTDEDREWFPDIAGSNKAMDILKDAWANYRDESFILQFLSPKVMRDFRLFEITDNSKHPYLEVNAIHNKRGYKNIRTALAGQYAIGNIDLDIQVTHVDLNGDRTLTLTHTRHNNIPIAKGEAYMVLEHIKGLWGYDVRLLSIDPTDDEIKQELTTFDGDS